MPDKKKLKKLLADGEVVAAVSLLLRHAQNRGLKELENTLLMLQDRMQHQEQQVRKGLVSQEQAHAFRSRIKAALLDLMDKNLDEDTVPEDLAGVAAPEPVKRNWWLPLTLAALMVAYIVAKDMMNARPFNLTVFVQGPEQRLFQNEGSVVLHIGQEQRQATINEKGQAHFNELPAQFKGKKARILLAPPQPYQNNHPDSLYLLLPGQTIYLEASLLNEGVIFGSVYDFLSGHPLSGVKVSVSNVETFTDERGYFELKMPANHQAKFQQLTFQKNGYRFSQLDSVPVHTRQEIKVALHRQQ